MTMAVLASAVVGCLILLVLIARPFVPALVWAMTLAVMFTPIDRALRTRTGSAATAASLSLLLAGIMVVIPVLLVSAALLNEIIAGAGTFSGSFSAADLKNLAQDHPKVAAALDRIDAWLDLPQLLHALAVQLGQWSGQLVQGSLTGLVNLLLTFYFLFYFLRDRDRILTAIAKLVPLDRPEFEGLIGRTSQTVFATAYATGTVAALQGFLGGMMFWALGLPSPAFWGVVMGLLAIVPFLGAFVIWLPAAVGLALAGHWLPAIGLALWGLIVIGLIDNIIYPILVGKRLSLHPMLSFVAIVGGLLLFGAHGIVLGPMIVALAQALLEIWRSRLDQTPPPVVAP
jgi:predicted PurR-regulated permease PerM